MGINLIAYLLSVQERWNKVQMAEQAKWGSYYFRYAGKSKTFKKNKRRGY